MGVLTYTRDYMQTRGLSLDRSEDIIHERAYSFHLSTLPTDILGFISCNYKLAIDQDTTCPLFSHEDKYLTLQCGIFFTENTGKGSGLSVTKLLDHIKYVRCDVEDNWQYWEETGEWDIPEGYSFKVRVEDGPTDRMLPFERELMPCVNSGKSELKTGYVFIKGSYLLRHFINLTYEGKPLHEDVWYSTEDGSDISDNYLMVVVLGVIDHEQNEAECSFCLDLDEQGWHTYEGNYYFTGK